ncbi:MAG: efflux RND transporter periplasmic adaptor subunit [Ketobacteraceae bacterium]|nr:efflux RND transporter periplasmic adaptor subunit [Ketobacteraceae bacterium]
MNKSLKIVLPILLLVAAIVISWLLVTQRPKVVHKPVEIKHPLVSVVVAESETMSVPVFTRGTVTPGTEIQLVSEVGGQVLSVSDNFANGGFFRKGEELIRIDPLEYNVNIKRAEANVAQAKQAYLQAKAEQQARARVKGGNRNALATYEVQVKQAEAAYEAAKAELEAARLQKQRTVIRAPFDGRVRMSAVSVGQYVRPGVQLGSIYAVDTAEVRLPLSDRQLGLVEVPMDFASVDEQGPMVTLMGEFGGETYYWPGQVVRSEGGLDERNRLLYVIARVEEPYAEDPNQPGRPPLTSGRFMDAKIKGKTHRNIFAIPRRALRNGNQVWVVDEKSQLQRREVQVLYKGKDSIYIKSGLRDGDQVVLSQLDIAVDGMKVRTSVQEPERLESADDMNLLGGGAGKSPAQTRKPVEVAEPERATTGITREFSEAEVREVAGRVKDVVDAMDDETKQQAVDSARKMADALKGIVSSSQKVREAAKPEPEPAPAAEPEPEPEPEQNAGREDGMSPLAGMIEEDIKSQQAAPEEQSGKNQSSYASISKAIAPEPITESVK